MDVGQSLALLLQCGCQVLQLSNSFEERRLRKRWNLGLSRFQNY
jgi:hypothetical protein